MESLCNETQSTVHLVVIMPYTIYKEGCAFMILGKNMEQSSSLLYEL